jgi:cobalt-zinc-cadmium efflux system outer membrane protein
MPARLRASLLFGCAIVSGSAILSSACATRIAPAAPVAAVPLWRELPAFQARIGDLGQPMPATAPASGGKLTLKDALAQALLHNPDLAAFAWETRAREARLVQAGRLPNPALGVLAEDLGGSSSVAPDAIQAQTTVQLSQLVELGGKRAARQELAARERDVAVWNYEAARIDTLTLVTRAFVDVLAGQRALTLAQDTTKIVEDVRQNVSARVTAGAVSPIEATKAEVASAAAGVEVDRARRALDAARRRLAALVGTPSAPIGEVVGDLETLPAVPAFEDLRARVQATPELARWAAEISQREAVLAIEHARVTPDITLTAGYRHFASTGSNAFIVGASIPLPLFDRNDAAIEEAASRVSKAREEQRAAEGRVTTALAEAYRGVAAAQVELAALRSVIIPGAQQAFDAVGEGYRLGRFAYIEVLDAQRTLIGYNAQHLRALAEFHKAVADVERLIGARIDAR